MAVGPLLEKGAGCDGEGAAMVQLVTFESTLKALFGELEVVCDDSRRPLSSRTLRVLL